MYTYMYIYRYLYNIRLQYLPNRNYLLSNRLLLIQTHSLGPRLYVNLMK